MNKKLLVSAFLIFFIVSLGILSSALGNETWADVKFKIAQVEASVSGDIDIRRGTTDDLITDPIWQTSFEANGKVTKKADPDDPIAGIKSADIEYQYTIGYWPSHPDWDLTVKYKWEIKHTNKESSDSQDLTSVAEGWTGQFDVSLPDSVGKYKLEVELKIYHDNKELRHEHRTHTLYVLFKAPITWTFYGEDLSNPKAAWLDVATSWADGENSEEGILDALNSGVYDNPFGWMYLDSSNAIKLIEGIYQNYGNCGTFRDVWRIMAAVLGIETGEHTYNPPESFLTSTRPALDGNTSANALNIVTGKRDRWVFTNHKLGLYDSSGDTDPLTFDTFYDPTFGLKGDYPDDLEGNIFCGADYPPLGPNNTCTCSTPSVPPYMAVLWNTGTYLPPDGFWTLYKYVVIDFATGKVK